jgi:type I restriction enzyme, S subunit
MRSFLTEHIAIWTTAQELKASNRGRSAGNQSLLGIKKLRELILELAVRGKLVSQDPNDEPASELLKKINREKARLVKEGKVKKQASLPEITDVEKPLKLPKGWVTTRLGNLMNLVSGQHLGPQEYSETNIEGMVPYLTGPAEFGEQYPIPLRFTVEKRAVALKGDILITCKGSGVGKLNIANTEIAISRQLMAIQPIDGNPQYLKLLAESLNKNFRENVVGIAIPGISREDVTEVVVNIPPLAEQHRIVAKVAELMALCDELENQQTNSNVAHETLVATLLGSLTDAENSNSFDESWQRIANHFDILFTTEHSIDQLKQTILQLAVMGRLVPQNPEDEPASELLKKINREKARLVNEGKIKKQVSLPEVTEDEKPFELPVGWEWTRLGNSSILKGGFAYQSSKFLNDGVCQVIRMGNIRPDYLRLDENPVYISETLGEGTSEYLIEPDDILLTMTGTKGKRDYLYSLIITPDNLLDRKLFLNQRLCIVRTFLFPRFQNMVMKSDRLLDVIYSKSTGTANQANIGMSAINEWVIPLPPLIEQQRIVSKVDELFALCDGLKERLIKAQTLQNQLAVAVVEQALN